MIYRPLHGTDLNVSALTYGPMMAADKAPSESDKSKQGANALRAALDAGINFIHSSYEYGTRWMMEKVLRDHPKRHELHHVIKVPVPDFKDGDRFDPDKFRLRIEEALKDLHTERIDVVQYMWRSEPNTEERRGPLFDRAIGEVNEVFEAMRKEGKTGYLFAFPYTVESGAQALASGKIKGLIAYYNCLEMEMYELFPKLEASGGGFLTIRPLYEGILTEKRRAGKFDRMSDPRFSDSSRDEDFRRQKALVTEFSDEIGGSLTDFAIRFSIAHPLIASAIVGMNTPEQVEILVAAVDGPLPPPETMKRMFARWKAGFR